jgi:hypothetical protein
MPGTLVITTLSDGTNSTSATNPIQGSAKAWVNFNGNGGVRAASYNVSSITVNGTSDFTINFATALADANYAVFGSSRRGVTDNNSQFYLPLSGTYTASAVRVVCFSTSVAGTSLECNLCNVAVFR